VCVRLCSPLFFEVEQKAYPLRTVGVKQNESFYVCLLLVPLSLQKYLLNFLLVKRVFQQKAAL
jgi:hypothetical protein